MEKYSDDETIEMLRYLANYLEEAHTAEIFDLKEIPFPHDKVNIIHLALEVLAIASDIKPDTKILVV